MNNHLKEKMKRGNTLIGWMSIPSTVTAEIIARAGFDAVAIDIEHSAIDISSLEPLFQVIEANGSSPLVRLSSNDAVLIKRVLDMGAHGIIVPMVNSVNDAVQAVGAAKYPPEGFRSTGIYRAQDYGNSFKEYRFSANEKIAVIIQIEHKDAVESIDEIVKVPGIDALMIGPYDLSSTYGIAGEIDHPIMKEAIQKVMNAAKGAQIGIGTHAVDASAELLGNTLKQGFSFVVYSNDSIILSRHYNDVIKFLKKSS